MPIINVGGGGGGNTINAAKKPVLFQITLTGSGWTTAKDDGTILTQTVNNDKLIASNYSYLISPAQDNYNEYVDASIRAFDVTVDKEITFVCLKEKQPGSIQVDILRIEEDDNGQSI